MFSIIIAVAAIALTVLLVVVTSFYVGGGGVGEAAETAASAKLLNQGSQIAGALEMHRALEGGLPTGTSDEIAAQLVTKSYLSSIPAQGWHFINDYAVNDDITEEQCMALNRQVGLDLEEVPSCASTDANGKAFCCTE